MWNERKQRTDDLTIFLSFSTTTEHNILTDTYVGLALRQKKKSLFKNGKNIFRTFWWPTFIFMWKL